MKNTLVTVQSIATQTLRNAPTTGDAKNALEARLLALSGAHDVLTRENWDGEELSEIAAQALEPYSNRAEDRLHLRDPKVRLPPRMIFSALLCKPQCFRCSTLGVISRFAAPQLASLFAIITRGKTRYFLRSSHSKRLAALAVRRL